MLAPEVLESFTCAIERDLAALDVHLATDAPIVHYAVFHAQQAVEKMLKLLLSWADVDYPRSHDIERLSDLLPSNHPLKPAVEPFVSWSSYAVALRYDFEIGMRPMHLPSVAELKEWRKSLDDLYKKIQEFMHA